MQDNGQKTSEDKDKDKKEKEKKPKLALGKVLSDNVFVLNDFYHSHLEGESLDWISKAGDLLRHVHICDFERNCPTLEKDADDLIPCVKALKDAGYDARISYECGFKPDFETAVANAKSLTDAFRAVWAE